MCGIAGIVSRGTLDVYQAKFAVREVLERQIHRGPEGVAVGHIGHCVLGHCQLSFQAIGRNCQPYFTRNGDAAIVMNGEIFNLDSLRARYGGELNLKTDSDSELIGELYQVLGNDLFKELNGMFAIAVYSLQDKSLTLARDRLGKKPLAYMIEGDRIVFSSEMSSILVARQVNRVSRQAVAAFLTFNTIPSPLTMVEGIRKVEPGHFLTFSPDGIDEVGYWRMSNLPASKEASRSIGCSLSELLQDATHRRIQDNVQYGSLLSGGLDSALITSIASKALGPTSLPCYSVGFPTSHRHNEAAAAQQTAEYLGCPCSLINVDATSFRDAAGIVLRSVDEPNADSSLVPQFIASQVASSEVKVLLSGDGADEFWLGYNVFAWQRYLGTKIGRSAFRCFASLAKFLLGSADWEKAIRSCDEQKPELRYYRAICGISPDLISLPLDTHGLDSAIASFVSNARPDSDEQRLQFGMIAVFLRSGILQKIDQTSMLNGIELRSPFLDEMIVDYSLSIPTNSKISIRALKMHVRQAARKSLPRSIAMRRKKGFRCPIDGLLRSRVLRELVDDSLLARSSPVSGVIPRDGVERLLSEHYEQRSNNGKLIWSLLCLGLWMQHRGLRLGEGE
ncbi:asparagine synthase (glutamine-hydrolyzing) [Novipirellula sp. SH528]|uniref:asparagine synthase (glutamine-hydrolyzing) n=1 Tax=Novipirellula sp. SH528 TaxID=3454466 RepID=UPI003F9F4DA5